LPDVVSHSDFQRGDAETQSNPAWGDDGPAAFFPHCRGGNVNKKVASKAIYWNVQGLRLLSNLNRAMQTKTRTNELAATAKTTRTSASKRASSGLEAKRELQTGKFVRHRDMDCKLEIVTPRGKVARQLLGERAIESISEQLPAEHRREFYEDVARAYSGKNAKRMVRIVLDAWVTTLDRIKMTAAARAVDDAPHAESA